MKPTIEQRTKDFYEREAWQMREDGEFVGTHFWEDLRSCATEYRRKCRVRVSNYVPPNGDFLLDVGCGPLQYEEYVELSRNYEKRFCVDFSAIALAEARKKIGDRGVFINADILDVDLNVDMFDCTVCLNALFNIDKVKQGEVVRKLLRLTKTGKPVIIVYRNPAPAPVAKLKQLIKRAARLRKRAPNNVSAYPYFYTHTPEWWGGFRKVADVTIIPWRSLTADLQRKYIPNNALGEKLLSMVFRLEETFPNFLAQHVCYPLVILRKLKKF